MSPVNISELPIEARERVLKQIGESTVPEPLTVPIESIRTLDPAEMTDDPVSGHRHRRSQENSILPASYHRLQRTLRLRRPRQGEPSENSHQGLRLMEGILCDVPRYDA